MDSYMMFIHNLFKMFVPYAVYSSRFRKYINIDIFLKKQLTALNRYRS